MYRRTLCPLRLCCSQTVLFPHQAYRASLYTVSPYLDPVSPAVYLKAFDMLIRNRFHPDALPDAGNRSIPHAPVLPLLLAPRILMIKLIGHFNSEDVLIYRLFGKSIIRPVRLFSSVRLFPLRSYQLCDIQAERKVSAFMVSGLLPVNIYSCCLIDRTEMQDDFSVIPFIGNNEIPFIYHCFAGSYPSAYAAESALRAERHIYGLPRSFRISFLSGPDRHESPFTVKSAPFFPDQLRPRIYLVPFVAHR